MRVHACLPIDKWLVFSTNNLPSSDSHLFPDILVLTYIDSAAVTAGIGSDMAFYLVAIANASSALGRVAPSFMVNRFGVVNVLIGFSLVSAIITFAWPFAKSLASLVVISILYGYD